MQTTRRGGHLGRGYKPPARPRRGHTLLDVTASANMVKFFSVDWLAQSHCDAEESQTDTTFRPHVPCMVQPSAPSFGKGYLQPKPKIVKNDKVDTSIEKGLYSPRSSSPISETSEYSSGYESEAASSECSTLDEVSEKDAQNQRRVRTKFTPDQINKLEKIFLKHKYLDASERVKTAQKLNLTETQVRTWFQNRRMKLKREVQDYLAPPPMLLHALPPAMQYQRPQYPHPHPATGYYPLPVHHHMQPMMIHSAHFY